MPMAARGLVLAGLLFTAGCHRAGTVSQATPSAETNPSWLSVDASPAALSTARRQAEFARERDLQQALQTLGTEATYDAVDVSRLAGEQGSPAFERLAAMLVAGPADLAAVDAAGVLVSHDQPLGREFLGRVLAEGAAASRIRVWSLVQVLRRPGEWDDGAYLAAWRQVPGLAPALVLDLAASEDTLIEAAARTAGVLHLPECRGPLMEALVHPRLANRRAVAIALLEYLPAEGAWDATVRAVHAFAHEEDTTFATPLLEFFAASDDPSVRKRARDELLELLARTPNDANLEGESLWPHQEVWWALVETSGPSDRNWLEQQPLDPEGYATCRLLAALVRALGPSAGTDKLLERLDQAEWADTLEEVVRELGDKLERERLIDQVAARAARSDPDGLLRGCKLLAAIDHDTARAKLRWLLPRLSQADRQVLGPVAEEHYLERLQSTIVGQELLTDQQFTTALATWQAKPAASQGAARVPTLLELLVLGGRALELDSECGIVPAPHARLVHDLVGLTRGRLQVTDVAQTWPRADLEDDDADFWLSFVAGNQVYRGHLRNQGDRYDVARVLAMLDRALTDLQSADRFVLLSTSSQYLKVVFADPAVMARVAAEFGESISTDVQQATHHGQRSE